ncbi:PAS domain S-box protein [Desulfovibrio sp. JC022]|uniref:PAS domain S-box protein n=1 Tax=Desulfovibrio sp. JC022 TaxID=2593642 RepID=UPI0013D077A7|nr:PAS domain S-box protein [Desulfovibrio sp. JC022]
MSVHFIVSTSIPFLLFAALVYFYTLDQFKDNIEAINNSSTKLIVNIVEEEMHNIQSTLQGCAAAIEKNKSTPAQTDMYLQAITVASRAIHQVRLLDSNGIVYALSPFSKDVLGLDMSNYPSFKNAHSKGTTYWSPAIISDTHRTPVFQISIPVQNEVLIANVTFPNLNSLIKELNIEKNSIFAITDQTGTYIAHTDETQVQQRNEDPHFKLIKDISGSTVKKIQIKDDRLYDTAYAASIGPSRWIASIYQNSQDVYRNLVVYTIAFITLALLILFLGMLFLIFKLKTITSHFDELVALAAQVSRGDYTPSPTPKEIKEFDKIASAFEKMSSSIQLREKEINNLNRDLAQKLHEITTLHNMNEMVLSSAAEAIFGLNHEGNIIFINTAACKMLGYNKEELIHRNHHEMCHSTKKDGSPYSIDECPLHSTLRDGQPQRGTDAFIKKDGTFVPVDYYSMPVFDDGDLQGIVVSAIDISERLKSEQEMQKLRSLLSNIINSMPSVLIAVDSSAKVIQWNAQAELESGIKSEKVSGRDLEEVYPKLSPKIADIHTAMQSSTPRSESRLTYQQDGRTLYEDITIYPLKSNEIEGAVIRLDDVTDKVHLEQIMVQSEKMMSLGGLAAGMAHEINNPLAGISGNIYNMHKRIFGDLPANRTAAEHCGVSLEKIRSYLDQRDIPKMLEAIKSSTERASTIVRNMLSFSRKSEQNMGLHNMAELLDETIDIAASDYDLKKQFDFKKIKITRDYGANISKAYCERSEVQQVFFNLLKNGAEAMKEKQYIKSSPELSLKTFQEGQEVVIQIEDNGPGMDAETRLRIFEPFYTTKPVGKGTGLGLSVSYFIITEQHGGSMTIDSEPGNWTRFTIKLPVNRK